MHRAALLTIIALASFAITIPSAASPVGGPKHGDGVLSPGQQAYYDVVLRSGEYTTVAIDGDQDGDLDCWLLNQNGNVVDADERPADACILRVQPRWAGPFRIVIRNTGVVADWYDMTVF